jgi:TetR/AcrR family transcriptional regulator, transcriptional repressor for nem operon
MKTQAGQHESKTKFLEAALRVIRTKGYSATRIEDVCEAAGLTKGSFFHHFKSKEELALAAAEHWNAMTGEFFRSAPYNLLPDPVDRLLAYVDFRKAILQGQLPEFTCLVGTMVQEVYETHPFIRDACDHSIREHAAMLELEITKATHIYRMNVDWSEESLALYMQAVIQGAFILAKAEDGPEVAAACLDHLRRYLEMLFNRSAQRKTA